MHFVRASIFRSSRFEPRTRNPEPGSDFAERRDPTRQERAGAVDLGLRHDRPIAASAASGWIRAPIGRLDEIEDEEAAGPNRRARAAEEQPNRSRVRDHLADCDYRGAARNAHALQRRDAEAGAGRVRAGETNHRRRPIEPGHVVAGVDEASRQNAAAASGFDDAARTDAVAAKQPDELRRYALGEIAEAGVVDVGEIGRIHVLRTPSEIETQRRLG